MARIHYVKKAQQRFYTVPVLNEDGTPKVSPVLRRDGSPKKTKSGKEVTMRVTANDPTRPKPNLRCGKCGVEIVPGMPYKWVKVKSGPYGGSTLVRCQPCPSWKQSELTSSKMAGIYAMQEAAEEQISGCETTDDLTSLASDLAQQVRDVAEEYRESQQNMEDGFGHATSMSDELGEKADELDNWADDIENVDFDEYEGDDDLDTENEPEREDDESDEDYESRVEAWKAAVEEQPDHDEWIEEQREKLLDIVNECPV